MIVWLKDRTPAAKPQESVVSDKPNESGRETFDQLVYAFLLLIVARAFLLEPFVIPTGSMAPTLYGRHKECYCESCDFNYQVGASQEVDGSGTYVNSGSRITLAACPNCRRPNSVKNAMAFSGDRVTVNKWVYTLGKPSRFDVFVFKFPEQAYRNYIKRLVGLPGESIAIRRGNLYLQTDEGEQILRKEQPRKRRAMTQLVHDNEYFSPELQAADWPARWNVFAAEEEAASIENARATDGTQTYEVAEGQTLRYTHWVPRFDDWRAIEGGGSINPSAQLITDYCAYNAYTGTGTTRSPASCRRFQSSSTPDANDIGVGDFWVPDIGFECDIAVNDQTTEVTLELVEGIYRYRCRIDCATGNAKLVSVNVQQDPNEERPMAMASTKIRAGQSHRVRFSNIDNELALWVDDVAIDFGNDAQYERTKLDDTLPTTADLSPAAVAVAGAPSLVSNLRMFRDVYYLPERNGPSRFDALRCELSQLLDDPDAYATAYATADASAKSVVVSSDANSYLAFGDNSPRSNDSRLWGETQSVPASHLVGKAFWIYWPHPIPYLNDGRGFPISSYYERGINGLKKLPDYPKRVVPFYPQFSRMTRIR